MKKHIPVFILTVLLAISSTMQGQIKVASSNNVGIGVENPLSKLSVGGDGDLNTKAYFYNSNTGANQRAGYFLQAASTVSSSYGFGIWGSTNLTSNKCVGVYGFVYSATAVSGPRSYGVYGLAGNGENGFNYGVFAKILGSRNGAAIYALAANKTEAIVPGMYSAYLKGMVYIEDSLRVTGRITCQQLFQVSDETLKRNITAVGGGNIQKLNLLNAVKYQMISEENYLASTQKITPDTGYVPKTSNLLEPGKQIHIGLIAQELQKVYPELVKTDENGLLSVNYSGLIPVLIEAIKEQQTEIQALKEQVILLNKKVGP